MSEKFQNKYRTESMRLQRWDYVWNGGYFITICTKNREHFLGEIIDTNPQSMLLNEAGLLAHKFWAIKTQC